MDGEKVKKTYRIEKKKAFSGEEETPENVRGDLRTINISKLCLIVIWGKFYRMMVWECLGNALLSDFFMFLQYRSS